MEKAHDIHFAGVIEDGRVQQRIHKDNNNFKRYKKASSRKRANVKLPRKCGQLTNVQRQRGRSCWMMPCKTATNADAITAKGL